MLDVLPWLETQRERLIGTADPIPWSSSKEWSFSNGRLVHQSGGFFSLAGINVAAEGTYFDGVQMPIIDQPEIGLLGFVVCPREDGTDWLLQAKSEPGSTHWVQVGPSVQATRSNYQRRHQGQPTKFLELFMQENGEPVGSDHSEQGSRFLYKYNRNAVVQVAERFEVDAPEWAWTSDTKMRHALGQDFAINTDARSVIVSHDWAFLRKGAKLFTGEGEFNPTYTSLRDLLAASSLPRSNDADVVQGVLDQLRQQRSSAKTRVSTVPLDALPGWDMKTDRLSATNGALYGDIEFQMYRVTAPGREVEAWDQPFSVGKKRHRAGLILAMHHGVLHVAFRRVDEPGFLGAIQLGPTFQTDAPCDPVVSELIFESGRQPDLKVAQSDEGGRFMNSVVDYEIHNMTDCALPRFGEDIDWLSISQIQALTRVPGAMTNEARSALSVILSLV